MEKLLEKEEWAELKRELENDRVLMGRFKEYEKYDTTGDFLLFLERVRRNKKTTKKQRSMSRMFACAACFAVFDHGFVDIIHQELLPVDESICKSFADGTHRPE